MTSKKIRRLVEKWKLHSRPLISLQQASKVKQRKQTEGKHKFTKLSRKTVSSKMVHRCGAPKPNGQPCRMVVENNGDKCRYHQDKVQVVEDVEHQHSESEVSMRSVSQQSQSHQDVTSEGLVSALLAKVSKLEADLHNKVSSQKPSQTKPAAKAKTNGEKKKRNMTPAGANVKARWIFYQEHKNDEDIVASVRGGLIKGNMLVKKTQVINGMTIEKEIIPYTLIKIATDMKYDNLAQEEKESYILEAYEQNDAK